MKKPIYFAAITLIVCMQACNQPGQHQKAEKTTKEDTSAAKAEELSFKSVGNMRNQRYCEILVVKGRVNNLTATVYNTFGCNDCPAVQWNAIDEEKLKKELNAKSIVMNGPRVFMMDSIGQSNAAPPKVNLGGIEMIERAMLPISVATVFKGKSNPYEENTINRSTKYVFLKGRKVYQLINKNNIYIMQSYALFVDRSLNETALDQLQAKIKLPEGWQFKVVTLTEDLVLETVAGGEAHVIQDDLQNSYQRIQNEI